jgi:hypothetical protein
MPGEDSVNSPINFLGRSILVHAHLDPSSNLLLQPPCIICLAFLEIFELLANGTSLNLELSLNIARPRGLFDSRHVIF